MACPLGAGICPLVALKRARNDRLHALADGVEPWQRAGALPHRV